MYYIRVKISNHSVYIVVITKYNFDYIFFPRLLEYELSSN